MGKLDALWEYQAVELKKEALEREVINTPARAKLNKLHGFLTEQQNAITRTQKDIVQRQTALEKLQDQVDKLLKRVDLEHSEFEEMQQDEECTAEEMTECRRNHEKLLDELGAVRREIGDLVKWLDNAMKDYKETRNKAGKAKKEYDALRVVCEEEYTKSEDSRKAAETAVAAQAEKVDPALLERYKKVKRNHTVPMAKVENNQCGGCNMSLPMVVVKRVQSSDALVECDNCGRILYVPEN